MGVSIFLLGIILGSFLNVCIYRIPNMKKVYDGRSKCGNCSHTLSSKDLVPIFSYIFLRGRCRYCKAKVSARYPFVEFLTGVLLLDLYYKFGISYEFFKFLVLTLFLIVIAFIDYDTTDVYSSVTYPAMIIGVLLIVFEGIFNTSSLNEFIKFFINGISGGIITGIIILGICIFTGAMGYGDIEIVIISGLFLDSRFCVLLILLSFIVGGIWAGILICINKKYKNEVMAFGPSIAIATYIVLIFGDILLKKIFFL